MPTVIDWGAMPAPGGPRHDPGREGCTCPVCLGLQALERPRFFAGQLLTEAELGAAQSYVREKSRLHNRYLHGPGVVCGLQVVCDECRGWVTVRPGYAIDPCGEDVVVGEAQHFDLIKAIRECRDAARRPARGDCDPVAPASATDCKDAEEHWCLTIAYEEREARPVSALRWQESSARHCSCGKNGGECGCNGGGGGGCACDGNGQGYGERRPLSSTARYASTSTALAPCEPTRIHEGFRLGVARSTENACHDSAESLLEESVFGSVLDCLKHIVGFIGYRVPLSSTTVLGRLLLASMRDDGQPQDSPSKQYGAYTSLRAAVRDLLIENPFNVRCAQLEALKQIHADAPTSSDTRTVAARAKYAASMQTAVYDVVGLLLQYVLDCVCNALMPPCSPNPADDRLVLACMQVKNDQIVQICNLPCRRQAGAFPALYYWLPLPGVAAFLLGSLCCGPSLVRSQSPLVNDLFGAVERFDPSGKLREAVTASDFALPRVLAGRAQEAVGRVTGALSPEGVSRLAPDDAVNLPALVGKPSADAQKTLEEAGVRPMVRQVERMEDVPALRALRTRPLAAPGDTVVVYARRGEVVGYASEPAEIVELRDEIATLRSEVEDLRGGEGPRRAGS
jgi:hypothetical protein